MICPKCGATLNDNAIFCEKCGRRITAPRKGKTKPRIIPIVVAGIILLAITIVALYINPMAQVSRAASHNDAYKMASLYFRYENVGFIERRIKKQIDDYAIMITDQARDGTITREFAYNNLVQLSDIPSEFLSTMIDFALCLQISGESYEDAARFAEQGDNLSALDCYANVILTDNLYYESAQSAIKTIGAQVYKQAAKEARTSIRNAYELTKHLPSDWDDTDKVIELCDRFIKWCGVYYESSTKKYRYTDLDDPVLNSDFSILYKDKIKWNCGGRTFLYYMQENIEQMASGELSYDKDSNLAISVVKSDAVSKFMSANKVDMDNNTISGKDVTTKLMDDGSIKITLNGKTHTLQQKDEENGDQ